ncbi:MAG: response regulator [Desulfamplus sp.]|nr:response regulator [Desulfamplus sp.]
MFDNSKILVIDDDLFPLTGHLRLLESSGYRVMKAETGEQGLHIAVETSPDVILLDVMLPDISGTELCRKIKALPHISPIIILISSYKTDSENKVEGLDLGADAYLNKSISKRELLANIRAMLRLKNAETRIRENEERMKMALQGTDEGIWDWNMQTDVITYDDNWKSILGYDEEDIIFDRHWWERNIDPDSSDLVKGIMDDYFRQPRGFYEFECRIRTKSGQWKWILTRGKCIEYDYLGKPLRLIGTHRDITHRKRAEEDRILLEQQLHKARKMESIATLSGGIAHEFNNLICIISGNAELLMESIPSRERPLAEDIFQAAQRGADLVKQLLTFSSRLEINITSVDIGNEIRRVAGQIEKTLNSHIKLELLLSERLYRVNADASQIERSIVTLVGNAADAMPGGGTVTIKAENWIMDDKFHRNHPDIARGPCVAISITDTGVGIEPDVLEKIFDPFFTTKDVGKGTGLGLSVIYGIIKAHGGVVLCDSDPGKGTCFTIYLPALVSPREESVKHGGRDGNGGDTSPSPMVLIVDDEKSVRNLNALILSRIGYRTMECESGEEALHIYKRHGHEISIVLLDLGMPGMGGLKCLDRLVEFDPDIKVIIASGYSDKGMIKDTMNHGASAYLIKPYAKSEIEHCVKRVLASD